MSSTSAARKRASSIPDRDPGEIVGRFIFEKHVLIYALVMLVLLICKLTGKLGHIPEQFITEQVKNETESLRELMMIKSAFFELKSLEDRLNNYILDKFLAQLKDTRSSFFDAEKEDVIVDKDDADGLGGMDYGLDSGDARVVTHSETLYMETRTQNKVHLLAQKMLEPSFGEPGECFALKGSRGFVEIGLRTAIIPEAVSLEPIPESVHSDGSNAPRNCWLSAWYKADDDVASDRVEKSYFLADCNAQTFKVASTQVVNMIRLEFQSNHGSPSYTCIYRLRVIGRQPISF